MICSLIGAIYLEATSCKPSHCPHTNCAKTNTEKACSVSLIHKSKSLFSANHPSDDKIGQGGTQYRYCSKCFVFTINRYCQELQHVFAQLRNIAAYERFLIFFPCIHVCSLFAQYWPGQFHLNVFQLYLTHFRVSHLSTDMADFSPLRNQAA